MKLLIFGAVLVLLSCISTNSAEKKVLCYLGSWSSYRPGDGKFVIENIDPHLCTHVIYAFVGITSSGGIRILDDWNEIGLGGFRRMNELRNVNPALKTLVAIGGWNEGSTTYSQVVNNANLRAAFVNNIVNFVREHGFDGFDLDWEYPCQRGGAASDKAAFVLLLKELRAKFDPLGYILSAAVASAESSASLSYDIPALGKYLDFINVMTYDLHGSWDSVTGHHTPLYPGSSDSANDRSLTVDAAIQYWLSQGAPAEKLVLGMGTYGRSFTLSSPPQCKIGAPSTGGGNAGPFTRETGILGYNEICVNAWPEVWDDERKVPYACQGNQWVGYDNVKSIKIKSEYILKYGLAGGMIWSLETDDFLGKCFGKKFPLLSTINEVLNGGVVQPPEEPGTPTTTTTTTTTEPPIDPPVEPPVDPTEVCSKDGFARDPNDCQIFYQCVKVNGKYIAYSYKCGDGLVFDTILNVCNWDYAVTC